MLAPVVELPLHQVLVLLLEVTPPRQRRRRRRRQRVCHARLTIWSGSLISCTEKEESDDDMGFGLFD